MAVQDLKTLAYNVLSEVDILKFGEKLGVPQAIRSFWYFKHEIDADKIVSSIAAKKTSLMPVPDANDLIQIIKLCKNLRKISLLKECEFLEVKMIPKTVATYCPFIKCLYLQGVVLYKEHMQALHNCTTLESLSLKFICGDATLKSLLISLPGLRYLRLHDHKGLLDGSCLDNLPNTLRVLRLYNTVNIEATVLLKSIEKLNLELLYLGKLKNVSSDFISALVKVTPFLEYLELSLHCKQLNNLPEFKRLKTLFLRHSKRINDDILEKITENCVFLERLELYSFPPCVTEVAWENLGNLPNLRQLTIAGRYTIDRSWYDECLCCLSQCAKLETLKVKHWGLSDKAALRIMAHCRSLTHIIIDDCEVTTDLIIQAGVQLRKQIGRTRVLKLTLNNFKADIALQEAIAETLLNCPLLKLNIVEPSIK